MSRILVLVLISMSCFAKADFSQAIGEVIYKGVGCPNKTITLTRSGKNEISTVKIEMPKLQAESDARRPEAHSACELFFHLHPPKGYKPKLASVTYYGDYHLPCGSFANLKTRYQLGSHATNAFTKTISSNGTNDFIHVQPFDLSSIQTECGSSVWFIAKPSLSITSNQNGDNSSFSLATHTNANNSMIFNIKWTRCD